MNIYANNIAHVMCNICKFKFELHDLIKDNAPDYTEDEVYATYCRVIGPLIAFKERGFELTEAKAGHEEFHHHAKGAKKCTKACGTVKFILVIGTRGRESVAVQYFLSAHDGVHVLCTSQVESMQPIWDFHHKGPKPKPLVKIQNWMSDWIAECMAEHKERKIFLFCYYTDSDLDDDWENKASICIEDALRVASGHSHASADERATAVRRSMGIMPQKGKK